MRAFGGLWSSQAERVEQSAQEILFIDHPDATVTAVVRLKHVGPAQELAWLIPVPAQASLSVSSSTVFQRLDAATAPHYWVEVTRAASCASQPSTPAYPQASDAGVSGSDLVPYAPLEIVDEGAVGPYQHVSIALDPSLPDPAQAALDWLTQNGYRVAGIDRDVLRPYLRDGHQLLALKLRPGRDPGALRPIVLRYESPHPSIPLRPAVIAAQADLSLLVWVVGPSQAVPTNVASLVLNDALIDWLSGLTFVAGTPPAGGAGPFGPRVPKPRNYTALLAAAVKEAGGLGFVTELAGPASQFRDKVWSAQDTETFMRLSSESYDDGIAALLAAREVYGTWDGFDEALASAATLPSEVSLDALQRDPAALRGRVQVDPEKLFKEIEAQVIKPVTDVAELLYQGPYLTRLQGALGGTDAKLDPSFDYNFDLTQLSNVHVAKQRVECGDASAWQLELPQGGVVKGEGASWPLAIDALPANLKIVSLSSQGPGSVVQDNSQAIGSNLFEAAGTPGSGSAVSRAPQHGESIGGEQSVRPRDALATGSAGEDPEDDEDDEAHAHKSAGGCRIGPASLPGPASLALLVLGTVFARRRRRGVGPS